MAAATPKSIDDYIAAFAPDVRAVLQKIRAVVRAAAPGAEERISYRIPSFVLEGTTIVYFAAFKEHIGLYPPVRGDAKLVRAVARYAGEKGNLKFPLDEPMPYVLIERIVKSRVKAHAARPAKDARVKRTSARRAVR